MLYDNQIERFRRQLQEERERVLEQLSSNGGTPGLGKNPDRSDLAVAYGERERRLALTALEEKYLQQVENALARLDSGVFGRCAECGAEKNEERLEIMPHAAYCVGCQHKHEQQIV
jgi:DnaK suppressor protein